MNRTVLLLGRQIPLPDLIVCLGLVLSILAVYAQVVQFDFISDDDDLYVSQNRIPSSSQGSLAAASPGRPTAVVANNWLPVTLLSYMVDIQIFGLSSSAHHLMNVA